MILDYEIKKNEPEPKPEPEEIKDFLATETLEAENVKDKDDEINKDDKPIAGGLYNI